MVKQKLDIGFFSCMYSQVNGTAHAVRFLSEAIANLGHNVHVYAPRIMNGHKIPNTLIYHDIGGATVNERTNFVLSAPVHKFFYCNHDYLDISHLHTHDSLGYMGTLWSKRLGIPIVGTHNSPMHYYAAQYVPIIGKALVKSNLLWRYERAHLEVSDLTHVPTISKKELLLQHRFKEPIICMTNGIHDAYFKELKKNDIREKYKLGDKKIFLYASRLSPEKYPISIIKIFKKIHQVVPNSHLVLVGSDGPSSEMVKNMIKSKGYEEFVSYIGIVPFLDLLKLYNIADLTGLWSFVEAEGLVLIEAMAQGTPSVGSNACGIRDVIKHGETGYLANNLEEFKEYVVKLLKDDDLRKKFGYNAKKRINNYKVSEIAKTWLKLYKFTINELHPLTANKVDRKHRVELVKEFMHHLPEACF